jgi:Chaperone of endosialidase
MIFRRALNAPIGAARFAVTLGMLAAVVLMLIASPTLAQAPTQQEGASNDVKSVLAQYGNFVQHVKYGEVWVPTVTPPGWHPYPPCHWVYTKHLGWYFDDKTPWGQIVHHYGRWTNDQQMGWIWVPDSEFSPGWVVWRTSPKWIGWAPTPPEVDIQLISTDQFNNGSQWIFMDVARMRAGCSDSTVVAANQVPVVLLQTQYITEIEYIDGIAVFVLPLYVVGPIVDISFNFSPWPAWFFVQAILDWNWIWTNTNIVVNVNNPCGPAPVIVSDIRLKRDIALLERLPNGIGLYRYRYTWSDQVYVGVMAQEVAAVVPDAVMRAPDGYLRVNYARLGMHLRTWDDWVAGRQRDASPLMPNLPLTPLKLPATNSQSPDQL